MKQSTPLHYPVYYFRLSCEYYSDEEREILLSKNKGQFLSLAENLLKNGHIKESWFYYYQLNCIAPLSGKHQDFFNFADASRHSKPELQIVTDYFSKHPLELLIPYRFLLTENWNSIDITDDFPEVKNLLEIQKSSTLDRQDFGKSILKIKLDMQAKDKTRFEEQSTFLKSIPVGSNSSSAFEQLLQHQHFITAQSLLFELLEIDKEIGVELKKLKEKIALKFSDHKEIVDELFQDVLPKQEIEHINQVSNRVLAANKMLHSTEAEKASNNIQVPKIFTDDFIAFQTGQRQMLKTGKLKSDKESILYSLLNKIYIEDHSNLNFQQHEFKEHLNAISNLIDQGKSILNAIFCIDEHYYPALHQLYKIEIKEAYFYHYTRIIQFLQSEELVNEYRALAKYAKTRVFISYSSQDNEQMEQLKQKLESKGIAVSVDKNSLNQIDLIENQLVDIIKKCNYLIVLISPNSLGSEWVGLEIISRIKDKSKKKFIPLILDNEIRTIEFREDQRNKIKEGWNKLRNLRDKEETNQGDTPKDITKKLKRVERLKNKFPKIYSEITEKISLDFGSPTAIKENFPKLLDRFIDN